MPETWAILAIVLMGLGAVVAGGAGVSLPDGQRMGALFSLIAGAGVGLATVGIGALFDVRKEPSEFVFFLASALGFLTVCVTVVMVRRRATDRS
jgi:drug/metabolite transporter (DMT)-like permease